MCSDTTNFPRHVAIIMDGNGRWAKKHVLNRISGHEKGAEVVRAIVTACRELNIPVLTLYAFSTENWQRSKKEVAALMRLLKRFLEAEEDEMMRNGIRLGAIGQTDRLPEDVRGVLARVIEKTAGNKNMLLNLALSYGGRSEIIDMTRVIAVKVAQGKLKPEEIDEAVVADHLYTRGIPDPDMLIRTSGEMRISNFLLWQLAYTEIFVTPTLWPDFSREEFVQMLHQYQLRERRFGKTSA